MVKQGPQAPWFMDPVLPNPARDYFGSHIPDSMDRLPTFLTGFGGGVGADSGLLLMF